MQSHEYLYHKYPSGCKRTFIFGGFSLIVIFCCLSLRSSEKWASFYNVSTGQVKCYIKDRMRNTSFISLLALVVHRCSCIYVHKTMTSESIAEFYQGRSVFITGATGFMGKVLVEKLLRSCPAIGNVYLLMRPSKGMDVAFRLQEFTNCIVWLIYLLIYLLVLINGSQIL